MLFLTPQTQDCANSSYYSPVRGSNWKGVTDERRKDEQGSIGDTSETSTCRKQQCEINTSREVNYEQQFLDILKEKSET